jgi:hypothetical protein
LSLNQTDCCIAARHIFGSEPSDAEVYEFVDRLLLNYTRVMTIGVPIEQRSTAPRLNPKRMQREIRREMAQTGISSKAHEAMRLQIEQGKQVRNADRREARDAAKERKREIAAQKAKARHRGH